MNSFLSKLTSSKIELGIVMEDDALMNDELGMYLQAEEILYFIYKNKGIIYGFTNKGIISKKPLENDTRATVKRHSYTQHYISNTEIKQGEKEIDIEVKFTMNRYNAHAGNGLMKEDFPLSIDRNLEEYAILIYKMMALLQERQQEQKALEKNMIEATNSILGRTSQISATLEHELLITKEWLLRNVFTTQFSNVHPIFEDSMKGYILHMNKKSNGELFSNMKRHFSTNSKDVSDDNDEIIDVEAEIIK